MAIFLIAEKPTRKLFKKTIMFMEKKAVKSSFYHQIIFNVENSCLSIQYDSNQSTFTLYN